MSSWCVRTFAVLILLAACGVHARASDELPPPRVIDRNTGSDVPQSASGRTPEPVAKPAPAVAQPRATATAGSEPRAWTTPWTQTAPAERTQPALAGGSTPLSATDFRKAIPVRFGFSASFCLNTEEAEDTLDLSAYYRVSDRVTVGVMGRALFARPTTLTPDPNNPTQPIDNQTFDTTSAFSIGPLLDIRLFAETSTRPRVSVGYYSLESGDVNADRRRVIYLMASKHVRLPEESPFRGLYVQAGAGYRWMTRDFDEDGMDVWVRPELEVLKDLYVFAEGYTGCSCYASIHAGVRWESPLGISLSFSVFDCLTEKTGFRGFTDLGGGIVRHRRSIGGGSTRQTSRGGSEPSQVGPGPRAKNPDPDRKTDDEDR